MGDAPQSKSIAFKKPYGGRRMLHENPRGGLISSKWLTHWLPGLICGYGIAKYFQNVEEQMRKAKRKKRTARPRDADDGEGSGVPPPQGEENEPLKMVLLARTDLQMSAGKIAAQCSHATLGVYKKLAFVPSSKALLGKWERLGQAKIVLKCPSLTEMEELKKQADSQGLPTYVVSDAGRTQVEAGSKTVLAIGPGPISVVNGVTSHLKLY